MRAADPIDRYLRELRRELRVSRWARRRIVLEARAHLLEAVEAERAYGLDAVRAAERALARFGMASDTARQFDGVGSKRTVLLRRTLVPWVAALAVTSMASATVWAFQPGSPAAHAHVHAAAVHAAAVHAPAARTHRPAHAPRLTHTIPHKPSPQEHTR
jgi:hypothetical protein